MFHIITVRLIAKLLAPSLSDRVRPGLQSSIKRTQIIMCYYVQLQENKQLWSGAMSVAFTFLKLIIFHQQHVACVFILVLQLFPNDRLRERYVILFIPFVVTFNAFNTFNTFSETSQFLLSLDYGSYKHSFCNLFFSIICY